MSEPTLCPLYKVHCRLDDAFKYWHEAERNYHMPIEFRTSLNTCLQELRNVTWILQSIKHDIPDFETWYEGEEGWQSKFRNDPIMKWAVNSRNKVVKAGNLEVCSQLRVETILDWIHKKVFSAEFDPFIPLNKIIPHILNATKIPIEFKDRAVCAVRRQWIDSELPDIEILEALRHTYLNLNMLLIDAHKQISSEEQCHYRQDRKYGPFTKYSLGEAFKKCPLCMIRANESRTIWLRISDASIITPNLNLFELSKDDIEITLKRYNLDSFSPNNLKEHDIRSTAFFYFEFAKRMIEIDGFHHYRIILEKMPFVRFSVGSMPTDKAEIITIWHVLATEVARLDIDRVITIGEAWQRKANTVDGKIVSLSEEKDEVLMVDVVQKDNTSLSIRGKIIREEGRVRIGEPDTEGSLTPQYLTPIFKVWKGEDFILTHDAM